MNLNIKSWRRLLDLDHPNHGPAAADPDLLRRQKGKPLLGKPRPGPETTHFIELEAYTDFALVVPALRELHCVTRYDGPE
ncbi:hypothetical protein [Mesorhizobium sp. 113-3-3]|uniref:hypothetical protein n=1 Tax=Mesorhizobium sp. 113-3-3 TaxID=2744516 RepID=UPI001937BCFB|nr:hypothetical protein [Mesorhizobium sp. 113-3-3]BCG83341.1 hypothetical protein MesoLj113b_68830 [Mesorhizobium sp. 113-3-3]